nr:hypothetical protein [Clostridia bacterium]
MSESKDWLDDLLDQVASGRMQPQHALQQFFLHKREAAEQTLTDADHAFLTAMDAAETAYIVARWCARRAASLGDIAAIRADLRGPSFFQPHRRPPVITALTAGGSRAVLFTPDGGGEDMEDCLRVSGSFSGARGDAVFMPVFRSMLIKALKHVGLPEPEYV